MIDTFCFRAVRGWRVAPAALPLALLAGGCTTGSSASFTMAPLFFSEAAGPSGEILADSGPAGGDTSTALAAPDLPLAPAPARYIAASGNAVLPVNAVADGSALPITVLNTAGLVSSAALLALPGAVGGIATALGPVGLGATLARTPAAIDGTVVAAAATAANTVTPTALALNGTLGATASAVTNTAATALDTVAAVVPAVSAPAVSTVTAPVASVAVALPSPAVAIATPVASVAVAAPVPQVTTVATAPVAAAAAAAPAALMPIATKALVTAQPAIPAATAATPAPATGLLAGSVTSLVQMCLMSKCR